MATLNSNVLSLADWAKRVDPDGKTSAIVEMLSQTNDVLADMMWIEGNLETGHRTTVRTALPDVQWRKLNKGVAKSKSRTQQVDEACGILEARAELDVDLAMLNGNSAAFRLSEASAFIEAMNQEFISTLFFGDSSSSPEEFTGFAPRYNSLSGDIGQNVLDGGGAGADNSSIWLIVWGQNTCCGIFPKGSKAGLMHQDLGEGDAFDGNNDRFRALMDKWQWKPGLALKDWRYAVRIANIDISNLVSKSSAADLIELMIKALHRLPSMSAGKAAFYMNRTCFQMLDIQRRDDVISGGGLVYKDVDGRPVPTFRQIPIRIVDQLIETEAVVS